MTEAAELLPVEASSWGKNAYYLKDTCDATYGRPNYAVCRNKMAAYARDGKLNKVMEACENAIRCGSCLAKRMLKDEEVAGHALYFVDRTKQSWYAEEMTRRTGPAPIKSAFASTPKKGDSKPAPTLAPKSKPAGSDHVGGDYAAAINAAMNDLNKPTPTPTPTPTPKPVSAPKPALASQPAPAIEVKPGMSILEIARAKLAAQHGHKS